MNPSAPAGKRGMYEYDEYHHGRMRLAHSRRRVLHWSRMKRTQPFRVVFEDGDIVVVDKMAGLAVLADRWDDSKERLDELLDAMYAGDVAEGRSARIPFPHRVFVVHRIDRDTSGLVVFAKTSEAHRALSASFETRKVEKTYICVVHGRPSWTETNCGLPLRMDGDREHRTIIDKAMGKRSSTDFRVLGVAGNLALLEASPETGRTHQIRAHLAALGHSIVCDPLYGDGKPLLLSSFKRGWRGDPFEERPLLSRLGLHAARLAFPSPSAEGGDTLRFSAPLARDLASLVKQMEKAAGEDFGLGDLLG